MKKYVEVNHYYEPTLLPVGSYQMQLFTLMLHRLMLHAYFK